VPGLPTPVLERRAGRANLPPLQKEPVVAQRRQLVVEIATGARRTLSAEGHLGIG